MMIRSYTRHWLLHGSFCSSGLGFFVSAFYAVESFKPKSLLQTARPAFFVVIDIDI